jgi:hypothetical protein
MKSKLKFKKVYFAFVIALLTICSYSQESIVETETSLNIENYKKKSLPSSFEIEFQDDDDKVNFKKLRDFLSKKKNLLNLLNNAEIDTYVNPNDINNNDLYIKNLTNFLEGKTDNNLVITIEDLNNIYNYKVDASYDKFYKLKDLKNYLEDYKKKKIEYEKKNIENEFLLKNIEIVNQDINTCQNQIDTALDPENRKQEFKTTMSICFVILIGILLISFFLIVYLRSDQNLSKDLLGGYGLQFITLFVLIIAIILFGILDILKGSELAAMLSGISGYILGKGIQDKKLNLDSSNTIPANPTVVVTPPTITESTITNTTTPTVNDIIEPNQDPIQ